eukprot:10334008-Karenia_brevis.AAC.1
MDTSQNKANPFNHYHHSRLDKYNAQGGGSIRNNTGPGQQLPDTGSNTSWATPKGIGLGGSASYVRRDPSD